MTLFLTPYLGPNMPFEVLRDTRIELPIWVLGAIPAAMFLLLGIGEIVMGGIARLPRLSLTTNPYAAQRADNLLRALTIGMLQGFELVVISGLGNLQNLLLMANLEQVGFGTWGHGPTVLCSMWSFVSSAWHFWGLASSYKHWLAASAAASLAGPGSRCAFHE